MINIFPDLPKSWSTQQGFVHPHHFSSLIKKGRIGLCSQQYPQPKQARYEGKRTNLFIHLSLRKSRKTKKKMSFHWLQSRNWKGIKQQIMEVPKGITVTASYRAGQPIIHPGHQWKWIVKMITNQTSERIINYELRTQ